MLCAPCDVCDAPMFCSQLLCPAMSAAAFSGCCRVLVAVSKLALVTGAQWHRLFVSSSSGRLALAWGATNADACAWAGTIQQ